jgi:hypothetical protein
MEIANKIFVGLPWKIKKKYENCIANVCKKSPLYFHIVGSVHDSQDADSLLERIKDAINSASAAIFDATGGNPNVSLEFGYAEAKQIRQALYLSVHKTSAKGGSTSIISDLAGKKHNQYKNEKKLLQLMNQFSDQHDYTKRYERFVRAHCKGKRGPAAKSFRALALKTIHCLDGFESRRRSDVVSHLEGEGYTRKEVEGMLSRLHKSGLIGITKGRYSQIQIR